MRKLKEKEKIRLNEPKPIEMFPITRGERELLNLYGVCPLSPKPQMTRSNGKQASTAGTVSGKSL